MGQKGSKKLPKFSEEMLDLYLRAEFNVMDTDKDGKINRKELRNLLTLLGVRKAKNKLEIFDIYKKDDTVDIEDYVAIFKDEPPLVKKTQRFRQLFRLFDKNSDGWATKAEIIAGLEQVEIEIDDAIRETVEKMDAHDDGKVSYQEFLTLEFQIAMRMEEEEKKKSMFEDD